MSESAALNISELLKTGIDRHQAGQTASAERIYRRILEADPRQPDALHLLGMIAYQAGDNGAAIELIERAIAVRPGVHQYHGSLGIALRAAGRTKEGETHLRRAIALKPGDAVAHYHLGNLLAAGGEIADAAVSFQQAVALMPDHVLARANLALAHRQLGRLGEAEGEYREVLRREPNNSVAHRGLAAVLHERGRLEEAAAGYEEALRLDPSHPEVPETRTNLAHILRDLGRFEEALALYDRVLANRPGLQRALAGKAETHERRGDYASAHSLLKPLMEKGEVGPSVVNAYGLLAHRFGENKAAVDAAERLLAGRALTNQQKQRLHYRLGDSYDREGQYDRAFAHYRAGNGLARPLYDEWDQRAGFDALIASFSRVAVENLPRADSASELPVFIVGMPRSGTSLVEQILASHPQIAGAGELDDIARIADDLPEALATEARYPDCVGALTPAVVNEAAGIYLERLRAMSDGAKRVTDKAPLNCRHLGLIALLFPRARIIHCVRDPLDTCLSCYFHDFGTRHAYSCALNHLGLYYRDYRRLMAHWRDALGCEIFDVVYEELTGDLEGQARKLVAFCGLEWDDACLKYHENPRAVGTASYDQVRWPVYHSSVGRWRHYEAHLGPLKEALGDIAEEAAGAAREEQGG